MKGNVLHSLTLSPPRRRRGGADNMITARMPQRERNKAPGHGLKDRGIIFNIFGSTAFIYALHGNNT